MRVQLIIINFIASTMLSSLRFAKGVSAGFTVVYIDKNVRVAIFVLNILRFVSHCNIYFYIEQLRMILISFLMEKDRMHFFGN